MRVAFTGHRPEKLGGYGSRNIIKNRVKASLVQALSKLLEEHPTGLGAISGMALGVDQWAVEVCIDLQIPFTAAVPFEGQQLVWPIPAQERYQYLLKHAKETVCVSEGDYAPFKLQKRNEWMVDHCDLLMAVWDGSPGGTANCVRYAFKVKRKVQELEW